MDLSQINWIVSLLAAIPVSILANLLTPKVTDYWAKRSLRAAYRRIDQIEKEIADMEEFADDPSGTFVDVAITSLLALAAFFAASGLLVLSYALGSTLPIAADDSQPLIQLARSAVPYVAGAMFLLAALILEKTVTKLTRLRNYGYHYDKLRGQLNDLRARTQKVASGQAGS